MSTESPFYPVNLETNIYSVNEETPEYFSMLPTPRISPETTSAPTIELGYPNTTTTEVDATVKRKFPLLVPYARPLEREEGTLIEALVLIDITVVVAIVIAEFCGGLWLRPLSHGLFSLRALCIR